MSNSSGSSSSEEVDRAFAPLPTPQYVLFWQFLRTVLPFGEDSIFMRIVGYVYYVPSGAAIPPLSEAPPPNAFVGQCNQVTPGPPGMPPYKAPPPHIRWLLTLCLCTIARLVGLVKARQSTVNVWISCKLANLR